MRVIGGKYKRFTLTAPKGVTSRPTTDKIKETMFNILGPMEGIGLDLFAGSGGLGVEGLSRGLSKVIFVDGSYEAIQMIKKNTAFVEEDVEIYKNDFKRALKALSKRDIQFNMIFLDPPYQKNIVNEVLPLIKAYHLLAKEGRILIECEKNEVIDPLDFEVVKHENYGITKLMILRGNYE
ncbi:16S rRNA (guanine(966)-N(2))-methyltransferase RsmD [Macrococcoides caseolyticum]|uniref:16S rRNA (guanine(966)-N(2))-methyltransferase RsmD n=1 Tax=Macrococcoides caseolyticum TaxID=69966 RepID=UPI001F3276F2|nr:16S rRNA (guanine(966)-N(2))-methyltransferase RsmD [Macrococcus caseolyticus]MCE4956882.1 16S rRNA (guanine(966)-N(2))-methyltransferase RsmD [Macrococcus caseolyticus]